MQLPDLEQGWKSSGWQRIIGLEEMMWTCLWLIQGKGSVGDRFGDAHICETAPKFATEKWFWSWQPVR
jgi:hypothetical protein